MAIMCMVKNPKEVMKVEGVSEGHVIHVRMGSTPACSNMQAADAAKAVSIDIIVI